MSDILVLAMQPAVIHDLCGIATEAGCRASVPRADEDVFTALDRVRPGVLLLDCDFPAPATLLPATARRGSCVVYVSPDWNAYELAEFARRAGVHHFVVASGTCGFRRLLAELRVDGHHVEARRPAPHPLITSAGAHMERSRALAEQSRELIATARELRLARQIALAACRANRDMLRETVARCTYELRKDGVPLEEVRILVRTAIEGTIATSNPALLAEIAADAQAAEAWCVEAYRAA